MQVGRGVKWINPGHRRFPCPLHGRLEDLLHAENHQSGETSLMSEDVEVLRAERREAYRRLCPCVYHDDK